MTTHTICTFEAARMRLIRGASSVRVQLPNGRVVRVTRRNFHKLIGTNYKGQ